MEQSSGTGGRKELMQDNVVVVFGKDMQKLQLQELAGTN